MELARDCIAFVPVVSVAATDVRAITPFIPLNGDSTLVTMWRRQCGNVSAQLAIRIRMKYAEVGDGKRYARTYIISSAGKFPSIETHK
jgi:hypothetical protein